MLQINIKISIQIPHDDDGAMHIKVLLHYHHNDFELVFVLYLR